MKIAFVSTAIAPYAIPAREAINNDGRVDSLHIFARKIEPGRQWCIEDLPDNFKVSKGMTLIFRNKFLYIPLCLPFLLRKYKPDVIVSEQLGSLLLFTLLYALIAKVPVLLRWEGTPHTEKRYSKGIRLRVRKLLGRRVKGFLCYTSSAEEYLMNIGLNQPKKRISYSVSDNLFYPPGPSFDRKNNAFVYAGQLIHRKGLHLLIPAFITLLHDYPTAELWIAGDGKDKNDIEASIPMRYKENIKFYGYLGTAAISQLMRKAGAFICPTLEDHGPVVQIEAAKMGLPIISSVYSGNAELVVKPGVNGWIVDPNNTRALADAMRDVYQKSDRSKMYETSIKLASCHSVQEEANSTVSAVLEIMQAYS